MMYEKNPESGGRNREEIYGNHALHVIFQERPPRLGWWCIVVGRHQAGNRSFGYLDSQLEQFAINPWCPPEGVGVRHLKNKVTDLRADRKPPGSLLPGLLNLQNSLKPFRCHRMTVSGLTMINDSCQLLQKRQSIIQKRRSFVRI